MYIHTYKYLFESNDAKYEKLVFNILKFYYKNKKLKYKWKLNYRYSMNKYD